LPRDVRQINTLQWSEGSRRSRSLGLISNDQPRAVRPCPPSVHRQRICGAQLGPRSSHDPARRRDTTLECDSRATFHLPSQTFGGMSSRVGRDGAVRQRSRRERPSASPSALLQLLLRCFDIKTGEERARDRSATRGNFSVKRFRAAALRERESAIASKRAARIAHRFRRALPSRGNRRSVVSLEEAQSLVFSRRVRRIACSRAG
jgi:hypothetical protein